MGDLRGMTLRETIAQDWKIRLVRWDGYHEHVADITVGDFIRIMGFVLPEPATPHKSADASADGNGTGENQ